MLEIDCDFSHDPKEVPRLIAACEAGADLALGSRWVEGGGTVNWGRGRTFVSRGGSFYARTILGVGVRDLTGGFKCFRRAVLETIDLDAIAAKGYGFQIETTYRALRAGLPGGRDPDHVRRPARRRVEDGRLDRRRGDAPGAGAALPRAARPAVAQPGDRDALHLRMDEVTDATFADEVLGSEIPVIVEFGAPWCRPCKAIEPALAEIAAGAARARSARQARHRHEPRHAVALRRPLGPDRDPVRRRRGARDARRPARQEPATSGRSRRTSERRDALTRPWDDLLVGEELASRTTEPPRDGPLRAAPRRPRPARRERARRRAASTGLYAHQAETWEAAARGEDVIVTTATASGKSLAFTLPVLDAIAREPTRAGALPLPDEGADAGSGARASPGFRLARASRPRSTTATPSPSGAAQIRKTANVILTNPDMLHVGILPNHDRWGDVLHNLRYVVVDEAHVYRGVFGSHVGNVLRRLRRLARAYGAEPQFLLASATIANAGELAPRADRAAGDASSTSDTSARARARRRALESGAARPRARGAGERALARRRC